MELELFQKLADRSVTKEQLLLKVKQDFALLPEVLKGISSSKAAVRYGCAKVLMDVSEEYPERLYPHVDFFINLLDSKYRILTWNAMAIVANLARVDVDNKFDAIFDKYYSFLNNEYMVTVASVVGHSGKIAIAKPHLVQKITDQLLKVENISTTQHLTEECKRVIVEKTLESFDLFFERIESKDKVISLAKRHVNSPRITLKAKAEGFLKKWTDSGVKHIVFSDTSRDRHSLRARGRKATSKQTLHIFSAGAVAPPIKKSAEEFKSKSGIEFEFTVGKAEDLIEEIAESRKGDLLTCGSEFILDHAQLKGLILKETRKSLGSRKSAILVQNGNPKKIESLSDLAKEGTRVGVSVSGCLTGVWDDIATKSGLTEQIRKNTIAYADGCGELMSFINKKKVDAILGWEAFKNLNMKTMDLVELPRDLQVYRSTAIAIISFSKHRKLAKKFLDFLVSDSGKKIYKEYGWHHLD